MEKTIKISADIKNVKSSLSELDGLIKQTVKLPRKIDILDKNQVDVMKKWASKQIPTVRKDLIKLKDSMKGMSDVNLLLKTKKEAISLEKQLKRLEKIKIGKLEGTKPGMLSKMPGIGKMGALAMGGLAGLGVMRGVQGYGQRMTEVPQRLRLAGAMGVDQYKGFRKQGGAYRGKELGFDVNETLEQANKLIRAVGDLRGLTQVQKTARAFGMDSGQITSQMGALRKAGGQEQTQKNFALLVGSAVSSNLDQGLLAEYMEATSGFVQQIATEGTADTKQLMTAVSGIVRQGGLLEDSARTTSRLTSVHESIKQSQGAKLGFFAQAFEGMLGPKSTGSQALLALNQGLFGANTSRLTAIDPQERSQLGLGGAGFQRRSQAITESFDQLTKGMDVSSKALIASKLTGVKDAGEAYNFMNSLKQGNYSEEELKRKYKEAKATPEESAINDMKTLLDMRLKTVDSHNKEHLSRLGEIIAPTIADVKATLLDIEDATLTPILRELSSNLPQMVEFLGSLVKHFTGDEGFLGKIGKGLANLITGGEVSRVEKELKDLQKKSLLSDLREKKVQRPLRESLQNLKAPSSNLTTRDVRRIEKGMSQATPEQVETIKKQAWEKIAVTTLDIARSRKEGKEINEGQSVQSILNAWKLLPKNTDRPKKLTSIMGDVLKITKGDPELEKHWENVTKQIKQKSKKDGRELDLSSNALNIRKDDIQSRELDLSSNALNIRKDDIQSTESALIPQVELPRSDIENIEKRKITQESAQSQESKEKSNSSLDSRISKLANSVEKLIRTVDVNTKSTDDNTREKKPTSQGFIKYQPGTVGGSFGTRRS